MGAIPDRRFPPMPLTKGASFTVAKEDFGRTFLIDAVDLVATMPAVSTLVAGWWCKFVVRTASATTGFSVSPNSADNIDGGTDDKDLINTAATDAVGDQVGVMSDGVDWASFDRTGTWAAEA